MKLLVTLMVMVSAGLAMAADLDDYVPTPRDEAVAELSSKRAEGQMLRGEIEPLKQQFAEASAKMKELGKQLQESDGGRQEGYIKADMQLMNERWTNAQGRLGQIERRLKELDGEIREAKGKLQKIIDPDSKKPRSNLRPENNPRPTNTPRPTRDNCGKHPL